MQPRAGMGASHSVTRVIGSGFTGHAYARLVLIRVVPYDPQWAVRFEQERAALEQLLAPWLSAGVHLWCERFAFRDALRADPQLLHR